MATRLADELLCWESDDEERVHVSGKEGGKGGGDRNQGGGKIEIRGGGKIMMKKECM